MSRSLSDPARSARQASDADDERAKSYAWRVLSVTGLGTFLSAANTSALSVSLPVVARHFQATATEVVWMLLGYMMINLIMILIFGRIADMVGRRRLYLAGILILTLSSLFCGLAPNALVLNLMRAGQGVGAAALVSNTAALLADVFPARLLTVGLGLNATILATSQVLGPIIGGAMASWFGWRAVFWFNVPIGLVGMVWGSITLRREPANRKRESFDLLGAMLFAIALGGIVLALAQGGAIGWTTAPVIVGTALFVVGLPAFLLVQTRRRYPLLDLGLFQQRERAMAYLATFFQAISRNAVILLIGLYVQAVGGLEPLSAGLRVFPMALGMGIAAPAAGFLAQRYSPRLLASTGLAMTAAGLFALAAVLGRTTPIMVTSGLLMLIGLGSGIFMTPNTASIISTVHAARRGIANGARSMLQNTGYVMSTALALAIVTFGLTADEKSRAYDGTLSSLSPGSIQQFTTGNRIALVVLGAMSVLGIIASLFRNPSPAKVRRQDLTKDVAESL